MELSTVARFVKRDPHTGKEYLPDASQIMEKFRHALFGFQVEGDIGLKVSRASFVRKGRLTRIPVCVLRCEVTVTDAVLAEAVLVRGVGRNRGLGFGMLMEMPD